MPTNSIAAWLYALGYISLEECSEMLDESVQDS